MKVWFSLFSVALAGMLSWTAHGKIKTSDSVFILRLNQAPLASIGIEKTKASPNQPPKINLKSSKATQYLRQLKVEQYSLKRRVEAVLGRPISINASYQFAYNGIAVKMTPSEAKAIEKLTGIASVKAEKLYPLLTYAGPQVIGAHNIWPESEIGGGATGFDYQGEGVIAGILDTGINPSSRSFAAKGDDGYEHTNPFGDGVYKGDCLVASELCNAKLVGIRSYEEITKIYTDPSFPVENHRPPFGIDYNGHGSHTASTVAGNVLFDVPELRMVERIKSPGRPTGLTFDRMSGVAPHANIISYQVCYPGNNGDPFAACPGSVVLKAIEHAIADGVDVINYSIGGGYDPWNDDVEIGFLNATAAGITVVAAAGNEGPGPSTAGHNGPWILAVAASTHGGAISSTKSIKGFRSSGEAAPMPQTIVGQGLGGGYAGPLVWAGKFVNGDSNPEQCLKPFPAGTFPTGAIVLCERGTISRVEKIANAAAGGAKGGILMNISHDEGLFADAFAVPGVHIDYASGLALKAWMSSGSSHWLEITKGEPKVVIGKGDELADFSSRGPHPAYDTFSPSITAPGVNIYAAFTNDMPFGPVSGAATADFAALSGTSMASPHAAGAALLVRGTKPDWSPQEIISALQLSAQDTITVGLGAKASLLDAGSGRVQVDQAVQSGIVLSETFENFEMANPSKKGSLHNLNKASVVYRKCLESCEFTRTLRATEPGQWSLLGSQDESGLSVVATPNQVTFGKKGDEQKVRISVKVNSVSDVNSWLSGSLNILSSDESKNPLKIPALIHPVDLIVPDLINIDSHGVLSGLHKEPGLRFKSTNSLKAYAYGLARSSLQTGSVTEDVEPKDPFDGDDGRTVYWFSVPEDAMRFVAKIKSNAENDLDLFVGQDIDADGSVDPKELVCAATTESSSETCDVLDPKAGTYWLMIYGYSTASQDGDVFELETAVVEGGSTLKAEIPSVARSDLPLSLSLKWSIDAVGGKYYGAVSFESDSKRRGIVPVNLF